MKSDAAIRLFARKSRVNRLIFKREGRKDRTLYCFGALEESGVRDQSDFIHSEVNKTHESTYKYSSCLMTLTSEAIEENRTEW